MNNIENQSPLNIYKEINSFVSEYINTFEEHADQKYKDQCIQEISDTILQYEEQDLVLLNETDWKKLINILLPESYIQEAIQNENYEDINNIKKELYTQYLENIDSFNLMLKSEIIHKKTIKEVENINKQKQQDLINNSQTYIQNKVKTLLNLNKQEKQAPIEKINIINNKEILKNINPPSDN